MAKKWIAINILLLVAAVGLGRELYRSVQRFPAENDPGKILPVSGETQAAEKAAAGASRDTSMETPVHNDTDYFTISENTIFSPLRGREEFASTPTQPPAPPLNPRPVLIGTIPIDGRYEALVSDPAGQQARGNAPRRPVTMRVGDNYRGYTIADITDEYMVLENGRQREVISMRGGDTRRTPAKPATIATRVVPIGPGGPGGTPVAVTAANAAAARNAAATQNAAQTAAQRAAQQAQQQAAQRAAQMDQQQAQQILQVLQNQQSATLTLGDGSQVVIPAKPQQQPKPGAAAKPAASQRVIRSPFGDIIRPGSE